MTISPAWLKQLNLLCDLTAKPGWDGKDAAPIEAVAFAVAAEVLESMSHGTAEPGLEVVRGRYPVLMRWVWGLETICVRVDASGVLRVTHSFQNADGRRWHEWAGQKLPAEIVQRICRSANPT